MKPMDTQALLDANDLDLNSAALLLTVLAAFQIAEQGEQEELKAEFGHVWARCEDAENVAALQSDVAAAVQPPESWPHSHQWLAWLDSVVVLSRAEQGAAGLGLPALAALFRGALEGIGSSLAGRSDVAAVWPALLERAAAARCALPFASPLFDSTMLVAVLGDSAQRCALVEYWTAGLIDARVAELLKAELTTNTVFLQCYRREVLDMGPLCYAKTAIVGHQRLLRIWALPHLGTGTTATLWATNQGLRLDSGNQVRAVVRERGVVEMEDPVIGNWSIELQVDPPNWSYELANLTEALQNQRVGHSWDAAGCQAAVSALDDTGLAAMVERLAQLQREAVDVDDESDARALDVLQSVVSLRLALQAYLLTAPDTADLRGRAAAADRKLYEAGVVDALCLVPSDEAWWTEDPLAGTVGWVREALQLMQRAEGISAKLIGAGDELAEGTAAGGASEHRGALTQQALDDILEKFRSLATASKLYTANEATERLARKQRRETAPTYAAAADRMVSGPSALFGFKPYLAWWNPVVGVIAMGERGDGDPSWVWQIVPLPTVERVAVREVQFERQAWAGGSVRLVAGQDACVDVVVWLEGGVRHDARLQAPLAASAEVTVALFLWFVAADELDKALALLGLPELQSSAELVETLQTLLDDSSPAW